MIAEALSVDKDVAIVKGINSLIHEMAQNDAISKRDTPFTIMEVCGTHTMSIYRFGLKDILPKSIRLISGPGCPVCVTPAGLIEQAIAIARIPGTILCTFGDMMRVPAYSGSLLEMDCASEKIRIIYSPLDALKIAIENPDKIVVFFAVGFETTAPLTAAVVDKAAKRDIRNFYIIPAHKTMPQALRLLLNGAANIDALLCPGHVATITGAKVFNFVAEELKKPAAIAGFQATDIMRAVYLLLKEAVNGNTTLINTYRRCVKEDGNVPALAALSRVFRPEDADWRGIGRIPESGLGLTSEFESFDALRHFAIDVKTVSEESGCRCGDVLQGKAEPADCPLMGGSCSPLHPLGACMVSSEGACAAYYKYGRR